jgi:hypothetical protein
VTERQEETIYTEYKLPDVLVPTIAIPEGLTINLSLYQQLAGEVQGAWVGTLQCQDCDNSSLKQMIQEVCHLTNQQQEMAEQVRRQCRYGIQWPFPKDCNNLIGPSAWKGELLSQTAKTMLLGALITTAGLWIFTMTVAMGYVTFRI